MSIRSFVIFATSILFIKKLNKYVSGSIGRAAVSKTAGWGFESLLTCNIEHLNNWSKKD